MWNFDPTITLGTVIQIVFFFGGGLIAFVRVQGKLDMLALRVKNLETSSANIGTILQAVAVQSQRLTALEQDLRELRHGEGFIRGSRGIDREYPG